MDIIVLYVLLAFIGCVDICFGVFDEITPADTADVGVLAAPDGGADITNPCVLRFAIEHIVPNNREEDMVVMDCAAFGAAGAPLQIIVVGIVCIRKNNG